VDARIEAYLDLLFKWNQAYRLTAFESRKEAMALGVLPSLAVTADLPRDAHVLDVGSGGGFPAVPLAITRPDLRWTLTEPSLQKAAFLREVAMLLELSLRVEARTVEVVLRESPRLWEAITVRGVRLRHGIVKNLAGTLAPEGLLAIWTGGEREENYARWASEAGLAVEERTLPTRPPLPLLLCRVPRGTSGARRGESPREETP
jgi:16S rRNA (guanine(527)-N(7))-methyltransferase RsmG